MKAVIPVAKKNENLFPFSESKPTGLFPVAGKPLVKQLINQLQAVGVDDIYLVTNYLEERFEEEFGDYTNVNTVYQEELTGTAKAVATCDFIEDDFFVVNGDVIVSENDLQNLESKHENTEGEISLLATDGNEPEKFGVLSITNDWVEEIVEKPEEAENRLVNTGIYIFSPAIFDEIEELEEGETSITDAVSGMTSDENVRFELVEDYWIDIGSPRKLLEADRVKRSHQLEEDVSEDAKVSENAEVENSIIEEGAEIRSGAVIENSVIAENVRVGPNTVIKQSTIGRDSLVEAANIESSLVFEKNILDSTAVVEDSIVGEECDVKSGTVIRESFIGPRSFIEVNNSVYGVKFVPDARTDLGEISK